MHGPIATGATGEPGACIPMADLRAACFPGRCPVTLVRSADRTHILFRLLRSWSVPVSYMNPNEPPEEVPEKKGMSGCAMVGIGCGIGALLLVIVAVIVAWWVSRNIREFGTDIAVSAMKEGLQELDVPEDQRQRMHARIDDVGQQFKDGKLDLQQVGSIFEKLSEGPLLPAGVSLFVKRAYVRDSGLSEEEKSAADISVQRFARGVIDKSIPEGTRESVFDLISTKDAQGKREFKKALTDDELREFLAAVTKAADEAAVPDKVPEINFADEFDKAVDEALGQIDDATPSP